MTPRASRIVRLSPILLLAACLAACTTTPKLTVAAAASSPELSPVPAAPTGAPASVPASEAAPAAIAAPADEALLAGEMPREFQRGGASWYGPRFNGRRTASGERYDMHGFTAAHRSLPFGTMVRVRSLVNGREVDVRINDRGPFSRNRIIDVSRAAADELGMLTLGVKDVVLFVPESTPDAEVQPRGPVPKKRAASQDGRSAKAHPAVRAAALRCVPCLFQPGLKAVDQHLQSLWKGMV